MIELRVLSPDDWALWRRLRLQALSEAPHAFSTRLAEWQGEGDREERWRARLSLAGARDLIAFVDGEAAGMASGVPQADGVTADARAAVELISLWVAPAARGRGVGDRLIEGVIAFAREIGARAVRLRVKANNAPALALYARHDLREIGAPSGDDGHDDDDDDGDERILERPLAP